MSETNQLLQNLSTKDKRNITKILPNSWVTLDIESTGLSPKTDKIIEIGAVTFTGNELVDQFSSYINPHRKIDPFISRLTGIKQTNLDNAPDFSAIKQSFMDFIGTNTVIGHNIHFDLSFLNQNGLILSNPSIDTLKLAETILPNCMGYSLSKIAEYFKLTNDNPHRSISDCILTTQVFLSLMTKLLGLDPIILTEIKRLSEHGSWDSKFLIDKILNLYPDAETSKTLLTNLSAVESINPKIKPPLHKNLLPALTRDSITSILSKNGVLSESFPEFEFRKQQIEMAFEITDSIKSQKNIIIEAGTGIGKSLAYLIPAFLSAKSNNKPIIISTNTINLQEQLIQKDIPQLVKALSASNIPAISYTALKGKSNYICTQKFFNELNSDDLRPEDTYILSKIFIWLTQTQNGERSDINLRKKFDLEWWRKLSAESSDCLQNHNNCFLKISREIALLSDIVIVNHALLISDLNNKGNSIPNYNFLIIDEAQNLENEATRQLGFNVRLNDLSILLEFLISDLAKLHNETNKHNHENFSSIIAKNNLIFNEIKELVSKIIPQSNLLNQQLIEMLKIPDYKTSETTYILRISEETRVTSTWEKLHSEWLNIYNYLSQLHEYLTSFELSIQKFSDLPAPLQQIVNQLSDRCNNLEEIEHSITNFIGNSEDNYVYWLEAHVNLNEINFKRAPLKITEHINDLLLQNNTTILTGATLSTNENFNHIKTQLGLNDFKEVFLGSPFNYKKNALVIVPNDMPEPKEDNYQEILAKMISDATKINNAKIMGLFTSYSSLLKTAHTLQSFAKENDINLLVQKPLTSPYDLVQQFVQSTKPLLLGTSSFWEGIDLNDDLNILIFARLPFQPPNDPLFQARSELYDNPFKEYGLPQAIIKFRQGFGRLIRKQNSKGIAIILDKRILTRSYGKEFIKSIPKTSFSNQPISNIHNRMDDWLNNST